jgi:phosphatidylglycerol:prolipoprotein diacylglycerol transferase
MDLYAIIVGIGAAAGLAWVARRAPHPEATAWVAAGMWVLLGALVGGRAAFVAANWLYFHTHLLEAPQIWLGGLFWPGALVGALFVLALLRLTHRLPASYLAEGFLPLALLVVIAGWLGCWQAGCAYGQAAPSAWWALPAPDEWGEWARRVPLQPAGAVLTLGWFGLVEVACARLRRPGLAASLALFGLGAILLGLSFLRADPLPVLRGWKLDTWASLGTLVLAIFGMIKNVIWH